MTGRTCDHDAGVVGQHLGLEDHANTPIEGGSPDSWRLVVSSTLLPMRLGAANDEDICPLQTKAKTRASRGKILFPGGTRPDTNASIGQPHEGLVALLGGQALGKTSQADAPMDDPPLPPTVADCLHELAAGNDAARGRILELCSERLRLLAHRMLNRFPVVRRWEDTDDIFQNAALRLYRCLGEVAVDSPREIMALAATQVHRELIDLARHHSGPMSFGGNHATGMVPLEDQSSSRHPADTPADSGTSIDRWSLFHEAINQLPAEQREIFQLVWYLGADQQSIARLLGCSVRTVKNRWREAREGVKTALGDQPPE